MPWTNLDWQQVLKRSFEESTDRLRVAIDASMNMSGQLEVSIDASEDSIAISDGTHTLDINPDGSINVSGTITTDPDVNIHDSSGANITLGQKTMANSIPIVIASDQTDIPVSAVNLDIRDLTHVSDSVKVGDGTDFLAVNADGSINATVSGTVAATQSGTWNINNISGTISLPTGASTLAEQQTQTTALQILDNLPHANDVSLNNGVPIMGQLDDTGTGTVSENNVSTVRITAARGLHINLRNVSGTEIGTTANPVNVSLDNKSAGVANVSYVSGTQSIGTSEVEAKVGGSPLANRITLRIFNRSTNTVYFGPTGVTTTTGEELFPNQSVELRVGPSLSVFLIAGGAGNTVVIQELA